MDTTGPTLGFQDLLDARPEVFTRLADRWDNIVDTLARHRDNWETQVTEPLHGGCFAAARAEHSLAKTSMDLIERTLGTGPAQDGGQLYLPDNLSTAGPDAEPQTQSAKYIRGGSICLTMDNNSEWI